ncbi:MEDS domain-containing protein [Acetobacterium malicum]|uniref:MEDS domain-containing protein n=1 Tax=Acetobacterium malicum TaxID=52692 RepID=UPI000419C6D0|nr:MEDS domain-containing protein [Acetobacterium dehalogenans]
MTDLLTVTEVAVYLRTTTTTIYRWLKQGKIRGVKIGKEWRIHESSLENLVSAFSEDDSIKQDIWKNLYNNEHLMVIASTREDIFKLETSFFQQAINRGNKMVKGCWWQDPDELREKYKTNGLDIEILEKENQLKIIDFNQSFKTKGISGPIENWKNEIESNISGTLWVSGSPHINCCEKESELIRFESHLNETIKNMSVIGICPYSIEDFIGESFKNLIHLMEHHSGTLFFNDESSIILRN